LPGDPPQMKPDRWFRCPRRAIDPSIHNLIARYYDHKAEAVPLHPGPIGEWPCNLVDLSRIMRIEGEHARDVATPASRGQAAAEAARLSLEAKLKADARKGMR